MVGSVVGITALLVSVGVSCSQKEIVVDGPRSTSTINRPDGGASDSDVMAVVARLSQGGGSPDAASKAALMAVGLRTVGMTPEEAACVSSAPELEASTTSSPAASPVAGVPLEVLVRCVGNDRLLALSAAPKIDLSAVSREEIAAAIAPIAKASFTANGLNDNEASCLVDAAVGSLDDAGLASLVGGSGGGVGTDADAVRKCLTPARCR